MRYLRNFGVFALACALSLSAGVGLKQMTTPAYAALPSSTVKILSGLGHGSGVHIGNGYVVTAAHVVSGDIAVLLDGGARQDGETLWTNETYDIALLRTAETMQAADLDCRVAAVGEAIEARGNPGPLEFITSTGRIAGGERESGHWKRVLIADISLMGGMSGGGVFAGGWLVGISVGALTVPMGFSASLSGFGAVVPSAVVCELLGRSS